MFSMTTNATKSGRTVAVDKAVIDAVWKITITVGDNNGSESITVDEDELELLSGLIGAVMGDVEVRWRR